MSTSAPVISTVPTTSVAPPEPPTTMSAPPTTAPPTTIAPPTTPSPPPVETSVPPSTTAPPSSPPPTTAPPSSPPPSPPTSIEPTTPPVTSLAPTPSTTIPTPSAPSTPAPSTPVPSPSPSPSPSPTPSVTVLPTPSTTLSSLIPTIPSSTAIPTVTTPSRSTAPTLVPAFSDTALVTELSTAVFTVTSGGRLVTITSVITAVVPAASARTAAADANGRLNSPTANEAKTGFFSNTGAVAGTFVVLGLIVAAGLILLARFFARRKRARQLDEDVRVAAGGAGDGGAGVNRFGDDEEGGNPFSDEDSSVGHQMYATSPDMAQYAPLALSSNATPRLSGVYVEGTPRRSQEFSTSSNGAYAPVGYYQRPQSLGAVGGAAYGEGYRDEPAVRLRDHSGGSGEAGGYATDSPRHRGSGENSHNNSFGRQPSPIPYQQPAMLNRRDSGESFYGDVSRKNTFSAPAAPALRGSDERLDPNLGIRAHNDSVASFNDERDYSRVLRVMNARGD